MVPASFFSLWLFCKNEKWLVEIINFGVVSDKMPRIVVFSKITAIQDHI